MNSSDASKMERLIHRILFDPLHDLHKNEEKLDRELRRKVYKAVGVGMSTGLMVFIGTVLLLAELRYPVITIARGEVIFSAVLAAFLGAVAAYLAARRMMALQAAEVLDPEIVRNGTLVGPAVMAASQKIVADMRQKYADIFEKEKASFLEQQEAKSAQWFSEKFQQLTEATEKARKDYFGSIKDIERDPSAYIPHEHAEREFLWSIVDAKSAHGEFKRLAYYVERDDPLSFVQQPVSTNKGFDGYGPTYLIFERRDCPTCRAKVRTSTTYRLRIDPGNLGTIAEESEVPPPGVYCYEDYKPEHSGPPGRHVWYCQSCAHEAEMSGRASRTSPSVKF